MKRLLLSMLWILCMSISINAQKMVGGDLSLVPAYESAGDVWLDQDGNDISKTYSDGMITYVKQVAGWNAVRVRLMVDPSADNFVATCQDLEYVKNLGKRIKNAGMNFLLDIFYSDTWSDVSAQWIPISWNMTRTTDTATLAEKVKRYTIEVMNELTDNGAAPDYVQLGNEVSYGMLWDTQSGGSTANAFYIYDSYSRYKSQVERFATLLTAAAEGIHASKSPQAKIILHCERTADSGNTLDFYDWVGQAGFDDYDIIGLSYYPQWHGTLEMLGATIKELQDTFEEKEIQIVETGYFNSNLVDTPTYDTSSTWPFSPAGQAAYLYDLITLLKGYERVTGLYYWQPEECGNGADEDGNNRVMDAWDNRGFWELKWKTDTHALNSYAALMALRQFISDSDEDEERDITAQFENLDFEQCDYYEGDEGSWVSTCPGWEFNEDAYWSSGPWPVVVNEWHSNMTDGYALQGWNSSGSALADGYILRQGKEDLPAGTYTVSAIVHSDYDGIYLFANEDETLVTATSEWGKAYEARVTTTLPTAGSLKLGLKFKDPVNTEADINLYADNFKVFYKKDGGLIVGDVNGDKTVDINDVVAIINHIAGNANYEHANVNGDSDDAGNAIVDINDVVAVINIMAGN